MANAAPDPAPNHGKWGELKPSDLKKAIENAFANATPGTYYALKVDVNNPISGYHVVKDPVP